MITTLLDNDFYAFTMAQAIWLNGKADLQVRYEFRNRTFAVPLASRLDLDLLEKNIDAVRQLRFSMDELMFLGETGIFSGSFIGALHDMKLPEVKVSSDNGHLVMTYEGNWLDGIFWETMLLSIVNEMYFERFGNFTSEGMLRLAEKIEYLKERKTIKFIEFGTRRRFSADWQHYVAHTMRDMVPDLMIGTSNVHLAKQLGLQPVGTMAHQLFMVYTALCTQDLAHDPIATGQNMVLRDWAKTYSAYPHMMTALTDTYGTSSFVRKLDLGSLEGYTGFRQDSGDPIEVGYRLQSLCRAIGVPEKVIFSDSLDVRKMSVIEDALPGVETPFGWGTNLTNDLGFEPLSIVIKPCAVKWITNDRWIPCVKISDDPQKATGDPQEVRKYQTEWWGVK